MATITSRNQYFINLAKGYGAAGMFKFNTQSASSTSGGATSCFHTPQLNFNLVGTTYPSTFVSLPLPPALTSDLLAMFVQVCQTTVRGGYLAWVYLMGTLNLAATGDQFTANAATFPILRNDISGTNQPVELTPIIQLTTATTTTAAIYVLKTNAGGAGYVDQDGNSTVGVNTVTLPAAATTVNSCFCFPLEDGDSGVRSISAIEVTTAAAAGAANVWGIEYITPLSAIAGTAPAVADCMSGGLQYANLKAGTATAGTATAYLCHISYGVTGSPANVPLMYYHAALNV